MDKYATDGQPGTLFEGEGIQYLLYSPVEGLLNITTKFTTDTPKTITPSFDPIFLQNIVNRKYFYSSAAQKSN